LSQHFLSRLRVNADAVTRNNAQRQATPDFFVFFALGCVDISSLFMVSESEGTMLADQHEAVLYDSGPLKAQIGQCRGISRTPLSIHCRSDMAIMLQNAKGYSPRLFNIQEDHNRFNLWESLLLCDRDSICSNTARSIAFLLRKSPRVGSTSLFS